MDEFYHHWLNFWDVLKQATNVMEEPIDVSFEEIEVVHNETENVVGAVS